MGVVDEVWGVLKWCNIWAFRGVSLMWFGVFLSGLGLYMIRFECSIAKISGL